MKCVRTILLLNRKIKGQHHDRYICPNGFDGNLRASAVTSENLPIISSFENLPIISSFQSALITDTGLVFGWWYHIEAGQVCIVLVLEVVLQDILHHVRYTYQAVL
jgi:hypothetical protein